MKNNLVASLCLCLLLCVSGCGRHSGARDPSDARRSSNIFTEAELTQFIAPGMSAEELIKRFGPPGSRIEVEPDSFLWTYSFPIVRKEGSYLAGFSVQVKGGTVAKWSPIIGETQRTSEPGRSKAVGGQKRFQLFIVTERLSGILKTLESNGSADTTGLEASPDLAFAAKVFAGSSGKTDSAEMTVILLLSDTDTSRLRALTELSLGKRVLIAHENRVIAAPIISVSIGSNQLRFTVKDSSVLDRVLK